MLQRSGKRYTKTNRSKLLEFPSYTYYALCYLANETGKCHYHNRCADVALGARPQLDSIGIGRLSKPARGRETLVFAAPQARAILGAGATRGNSIARFDGRGSGTPRA